MIFANLVWLWWVLGVVGFLLVGGLIFSIFFTFYVAKQVYFHTLVKRTPEEWGRVCSALDNEEQVKMWEEGLKWGKANKEHIKEVSITSEDGLKLVGEFIDFGHKQTAIILSGRCECLWYGYFYALPYQKAGYNILVIDARAHGKSEGKYATAGILESKDTVLWMKYLHEKFNQEGFVLHCICVGGSTGLLAAKTEFGKQYVKKIVLDGAYISFKESYKRHYIAKGHALFPVYYQVWYWFKHYTHCNPNDSVPLDIINDNNATILFIHSKKDIFSLPEKAELLMNTFKGEKHIKWFEEGSHSHVRINNVKEYDESIIGFVK